MASKTNVDPDLMPDGAGSPEDSVDGEYDLDNLRVNFSDEEAGSEARSFEALPAGKYRVNITDVEVQKSKSEKNPGKPFYHLELTIQEGQYENRKLWANVMLFEGALYSLAQLEKALGWSEDRVKSGEVIKASELQGAELVVFVSNKVDKYQIDQGNWDGVGAKPRKNDVQSYFSADSLSGAGGSSSSLMP